MQVAKETNVTPDIVILVIRKCPIRQIQYFAKPCRRTTLKLYSFLMCHFSMQCIMEAYSFISGVLAGSLGWSSFSWTSIRLYPCSYCLKTKIKRIHVLQFFPACNHGESSSHGNDRRTRHHQRVNKIAKSNERINHSVIKLNVPYSCRAYNNVGLCGVYVLN